MWLRYTHGAVKARSRRGRGTPVVRSRHARGAVEVHPWCGRGAVPVRCGTLTFYRAVL